MTDQPNDLQACFQRGVAARAAGHAEGENPYRRETPAWREWRAGWRATCDLDEEDDPTSDRLHKEDDLPNS